MPSVIEGVLLHPVYSRVIFTSLLILLTVVLVRLWRKYVGWQHSRIASRLRPENRPGAQTRFEVLRRLGTGAILTLAVFLLLFFVFPQIWSYGMWFIASAGLFSLVIGMAAQSTLSNLIAGIALSFSQPVRLNDSVLYGSDWGWVEEITLMHTVIRTWDNRRIVIPNSMLSTTVIQNWSMKDSWLLGTVVMYVDYTCDVDLVRKWTREIVEGSTYSTEEKLAVVQVIDFTEKSMVLRILGKSWDALNTWQLRCEMREKLVKKFHEAGLPLPHVRVTDVSPALRAAGDRWQPGPGGAAGDSAQQ